MLTILFVCTGNTCRSPMAKALFLQRLHIFKKWSDNGEIEVCSAGIFTQNDLPASPEAIAAMREKGIDISQHRSLILSPSLIWGADLILTMSVSQRDYLLNRYPDKSSIIYTLSEFTGDETGEVIDPYGQGLEYYRKTISQLNLLVDRLFQKIVQL